MRALRSLRSTRRLAAAGTSRPPRPHPVTDGGSRPFARALSADRVRASQAEVDRLVPLFRLLGLGGGRGGGLWERGARRGGGGGAAGRGGGRRRGFAGPGRGGGCPRKIAPR